MVVLKGYLRGLSDVMGVTSRGATHSDLALDVRQPPACHQLRTCLLSKILVSASTSSQDFIQRINILLSESIVAAKQ